ncbi:MAG TPA: tetratricopeptide repeat protein [Deltaproteobacteria bacterium]|nr:tetratricopeptide repeat protein [Deltaproteobacteria bacterium]
MNVNPARVPDRRREKRRRSTVCFVILAAVITAGAASCSTADRTAMRFLDTAEHHTYTGIVLIEQEKYDDAEREFERAVQLNDKSALGYAGLALIRAGRGQTEEALRLIEKAEQCARDAREQLFIHVARIRLYTLSRRPTNWVELAQQEFESAIAVDPRSAPAYYFMGLARMRNHEFEKAARHFIKVLDLNDGYVEQADRQWKRAMTISAAEPMSFRVEEAALADTLTRGSLALFLVEELRVDELYHGLGLYDDSAAPEKQPSDIEIHPCRREIEKVAALRIQGLEPYPDGDFYPDDVVSRLNMAIVLYGILVKVTGDEQLADRYVSPSEPGEEGKEHSLHEAARVIIARDIMEPELFTSTELAPYEPISGDRALMAIHNFKEALLIGF